MQTSCYARLKQFAAAGLVPVGISRGVPRWFNGQADQRLAPTRAMLSMSQAEYNRLFAEILAKLDPVEVYQGLPENAVLLCWEAPGVSCHRRWVAEWLEQANGVVIPEFGFERAECKPYRAMPGKAARDD